MKLARLAAGLACFTIGTCGSARWMARIDPDEEPLARAVAERVSERAETDALVYHTHAARFDCQASIAVYQMTILGLGQLVLAHPETRDAYLPAMRHAADLMLRPEAMDYARRTYGHDPLTTMLPDEGYAYLGYVNLALGMLRAVDPATKHAALNDRLTFELARRIESSPHGMIETYPGETWPPDVAAVVGSIGLHATVTHTDRRAFMATWASRFACAIDASGYLVQRVDDSCKPLDGPRGSGTAVASYFLAFADRELSHRLYLALVQNATTFFGFGALHEYAPGREGRWDVNAGPMLFGISVGATGFGIGAARINGDADTFARLVRSANLAGVPTTSGGRRTYALGGLLGDALLLAMLTARAP